MPLPATKMVLLGQKRADKEITVFSVDRKASLEDLEKLQREAERVRRELQAALNRGRRG